MNKQDDGGPAFPGEYIDMEAGETREYSGLSKRDYFAGQALVEVMRVLNSNEFFGIDTRCPYATSPCEAYASAAYHVADAMIAASKEQDHA